METLKKIKDIAIAIWMFLDGKKTALGAMFFFVRDFVVLPYYSQVVGTPVPAEVSYVLGVFAALFTVLGVMHSGVKAYARRSSPVA